MDGHTMFSKDARSVRQTPSDHPVEPEWLREFQAALRNTDTALRMISAQLVTLREAGMDSVADRFVQPFMAAVSGVETMSAAVGRVEACNRTREILNEQGKDNQNERSDAN